MEDGKRIRTKLENIKSIDDICRVVPYMSKVRCIIKPVKLWAQPASKKDPQYGITFKVYKIEVELPQNNYSRSKTILESDNFIDSDNEETNTELNSNDETTDEQIINTKNNISSKNIKKYLNLTFHGKTLF